MFDEHEARRLLGRAADTIEVSSALSAPPPPRRRTALIAAAAVAALAVGGGIVASQLDIGDDNQDPTAPHADGTVPSVFSHSEGSARALLSAAGYDVKIEERHACTEAGRAEQTRPVAGSPLPRAPPSPSSCHSACAGLVVRIDQQQVRLGIPRLRERTRSGTALRQDRDRGARWREALHAHIRRGLRPGRVG